MAILLPGRQNRNFFSAFWLARRARSALRRFIWACGAQGVVYFTVAAPHFLGLRYTLWDFDPDRDRIQQKMWRTSTARLGPHHNFLACAHSERKDPSV